MSILSFIKNSILFPPKQKTQGPGPHCIAPQYSSQLGFKIWHYSSFHCWFSGFMWCLKGGSRSYLDPDLRGAFYKTSSLAHLLYYNCTQVRPSAMARTPLPQKFLLLLLLHEKREPREVIFFDGGGGPITLYSLRPQKTDGGDGWWRWSKLEQCLKVRSVYIYIHSVYIYTPRARTNQAKRLIIYLARVRRKRGGG